MKAVQKIVANRERRLEILLVVGALALSGLGVLFLISGLFTSVQEKNEILPVSLGSKQSANYDAPTPNARIPAPRLDLIAEAIHDTDPAANAQARYNVVLESLRTPVPGGPPMPTSSPFPSPSPTSQILPRAVYVTKIRLDPPEPKQQQDVLFNVTFLNTTGTDQTYRWFIFIYRQGQRQPFGQTSSDRDHVIPVGTVEQPAVNTWKMGSSEPCTTLEARVHWQDPDGSRPIFNNTDGQPYVLTFTMCQ
jgi:hypothetical protein